MRTALFITCFLILCLESPLLLELRTSLYPPDIVITALIFIRIHSAFLPSLLFVFMLGLVKDSLTMGSPLGLYTEIYVLLLFLNELFIHRVNFNSSLSIVMVSFVYSTVASLLFFLFSLIFDSSFSNYGIIFDALLPSALLTSLCSPLFFYLFTWIGGRFRRRMGGREIIV
ncbi:MAG: rod shape-determining protein MreD [Deltaproteobacteria bacterium]|nr:rod shape-determining protein MreD [Deltaproteobacteria bacterium]